MTKQELLKLSQKAKKDFDLIANRGLEQIRHQLSFFYLSDLTLSEEQNDEVTSYIKKHLQDDAEENEKTLYRRYLLQAEFIYQQYSSHESKPTKETMNHENNLLAGLSLEALKQKYQAQKLGMPDLSDEGRAKLRLVQQEFDERQALFNKVFLRGDKPEWTLDACIQRMKTAVSLADILDYGATASVFTKIDLEVNNWIPETVGGMRAGGMNELSGYLEKLKKNDDHILALFTSNLSRYGAITGMPGMLKAQIRSISQCDENNVEIDSAEQVLKGVIEHSIRIEKDISSKGHKMQDTLNALNKKMNSMSQRNNLTSALSKALVLAKALTSRVMGFLFNEPSQKRELERVVDLVADTFDKYKGRSDIPASRIIELKQKLQNLKEKMQDDTYPYSARLENKITVLSYEMEEVINQKMKHEKRKKSQSNVTSDVLAPHASLTPAKDLQEAIASNQNSTNSALPPRNQTEANRRSPKKQSN